MYAEVISPQIPADEAARLESLRAFDVLDTPPEAAFERIVALASRVFNAPIALISLVDEDRQWNKACIGLDMRETDRRISFCAHAILEDGPLVVLDMLEDERFNDNPFVAGEPHVRFYAGAGLETAHGHKLGTLCILDTQPRATFSAEERATLSDLASTVTDALELRRANQRLRDLETQVSAERRLLAETFASLEDGVVVQDNTGRIVVANESAARILGLSMDQLLGRTSVDPHWRTVREDGSEFPGDEHPVPVALRCGVVAKDVVMGVYHPDGDLAWIQVNARPLKRDPESAPYAAVGSFTDVTERFRQQRRLEFLVYHDALTGLPNRPAFLARANAALGSTFAVGFLDLDSFKCVNDTHGHDMGDELLKVVAQRLACALRAGDVIARFGGDEFALFLPGVATPAHAARVAERLQAALEPSITLRPGLEVSVVSSVGFAFHPTDGEDVTELLRGADARMYEHKGVRKSAPNGSIENARA